MKGLKRRETVQKYAEPISAVHSNRLKGRIDWEPHPGHHSGNRTCAQLGHGPKACTQLGNVNRSPWSSPKGVVRAPPCFLHRVPLGDPHVRVIPLSPRQSSKSGPQAIPQAVPRAATVASPTGALETPQAVLRAFPWILVLLLERFANKYIGDLFFDVGISFLAVSLSLDVAF